VDVCGEKDFGIGTDLVSSDCFGTEIILLLLILLSSLSTRASS
jgi:hypothetical protein